MNKKLLSILMVIIGLIFYSAYPISKYYNTPLSDFIIFLIVSLGCCLIILGNLIKYYSNTLLIYIIAIFIAFSLLPLVIENITIRFWIITIVAILTYWYKDKKYEKKNSDKID